jgi:hypothetical protein
MRAISRLALVAALLIGLMPATVSAQRWAVDWGVNGGASWYSQLISGDNAPPDGARFRAGWLVGSQLTFWPAANIGLRANMTYTDRPLVADEDIAGLGSDEIHGNINLWSGTGDLLIRFGRPAETWMGRETLPYLALGLGAKWINPAADLWFQQDGTSGIPFTTNPGAAGQTTLWLEETSVLMGLVGLGADFRLSPRTALRLEVNDRIYRPRVYTTTGAIPGPGGTVNVSGDNNVARTVHEIGAQLGLHFLFGLRTPPPVAVAPLPPAPPPPPPPPAPEPPREDQVTVCVIDPTAPGGIRMQTAVFRHAQRDTVVMVDGQRRPLQEVVPTVPVARTAEWYVQGQPLTLTVGREQVRFLPYQTATVIEPQRIVYIGNVGGYPVYADRDEVADVLARLQTLRGDRTDAELGTLLAQDRAVRDAVQRVSFLYVPLDGVGCVFQPVQRQVDVRKGK